MHFAGEDAWGHGDGKAEKQHEGQIEHAWVPAGEGTVGKERSCQQSVQQRSRPFSCSCATTRGGGRDPSVVLVQCRLSIAARFTIADVPPIPWGGGWEAGWRGWGVSGGRFHAKSKFRDPHPCPPPTRGRGPWIRCGRVSNLCRNGRIPSAAVAQQLVAVAATLRLSCAEQVHPSIHNLADVPPIPAGGERGACGRRGGGDGGRGGGNSTPNLSFASHGGLSPCLHTVGRVGPRGVAPNAPFSSSRFACAPSRSLHSGSLCDLVARCQPHCRCRHGKLCEGLQYQGGDVGCGGQRNPLQHRDERKGHLRCCIVLRSTAWTGWLSEWLNAM
jgi:hypothetical protein